MDFVVIGLGLSALALLTGLTLLCLVAPRWFRKAGVAQPGDAAYARAQAGARHALGQGFLCAGAVLLLTTFGGISAGLADKAGAYLIATMTTLAALGLVGWDLLYRRQHPIPARRRAAPARARRAADDPGDASSAGSPTMSPVNTTTVRRRVLPARQRLGPAAPPIAAMAAPSEALDDDAQVAIREDQPGEDVLESPAGSQAPEVAASDTVTPELQDNEPAANPAGTGDTASGSLLFDAHDATPAGDPAATAALPIEPETLEPANTNGASDQPTSTSFKAEPDVLLHGDDRVIALFPTATARRSRTIVSPTDPDGQS